MPTIREIVARRTDLGTFVVHLTRQQNDEEPVENLKSILSSGTLEARGEFGIAKDHLKQEESLASQRCVCFTETPLEHLHLMLTEATDMTRNCTFAPYGIAITKKVARQAGVNPVWYVDITPGHEWLMNPLNELVLLARRSMNKRRKAGEAAPWGEYPIARVAPFIEQMGTGLDYRKEFWWEREWRHVGDFSLPRRILVIAPQAEHRTLADFVVALDRGWRVRFIDASWGIEEIIGYLAGFRADDTGPF